jgi:hypothetical protein
MSKELTTTNQIDFIIPTENNEIPVDELDGFTLSFDKVKIPAGGTTAFEVPGDDPDNPDIVKELKVIIVDQYPSNAYYKNAYDGTENAPDCSSNDGHQGINSDGEIINCETCPNNKYGSAVDGVGKACKNMRKVYILRSGDTFPMLLTLPATSLNPFGKYLQRIVSKGLRPCDVVTKIALKKAESKGGITYAQATFSMEEILPAEIREKVRKYVTEMKKTTRIARADDFIENNSTTEDTDLPF